MEDRRIHDRITLIEVWVNKHEARHADVDLSIKQNIELAKKIEANTSEMVSLLKGAKSTRAFLVWVSPLIAFIAMVVGAFWAALTWFSRH